MTAEQKQRMAHELGQWNAAMKSSCSVSDLLAISTRMSALLQELIDAPEPEPVAHAILLPNGATRIWFSDRDSGELWRAREGVKQELTPLYTAPPANNQSEQHLERVNLPALSVPNKPARDEITRMAREAGFVGMDARHGALSRFAALVALAEREECAALCDRFQARDVGMQPAECAAAIRTRGKIAMNQPLETLK